MVKGVNKWSSWEQRSLRWQVRWRGSRDFLNWKEQEAVLTSYGSPAAWTQKGRSSYRCQPCLETLAVSTHTHTHTHTHIHMGLCLSTHHESWILGPLLPRQALHYKGPATMAGDLLSPQTGAWKGMPQVLTWRPKLQTWPQGPHIIFTGINKLRR